MLSCDTRHGPTFYVGATADLRRRLSEHNTGAGSAWTRHWYSRGSTWRLEETEQVSTATAGLHEDMHTLGLIRAYGLDRVRGGRFSQVRLPHARIAEIKHAMWHNDGRCLMCGAASHTAVECSAGVDAKRRRGWGGWYEVALIGVVAVLWCFNQT